MLKQITDIATLILVLILCALVWLRGGASPAPDKPPDTPPAVDADVEATPSPLAKVGAEYYRTLPATFHDLAKQFRSPTPPGKDAAQGTLKAHRQAYTDLLDRVYAASTDDAGNVTKPKALAAEFDAVGRAMDAVIAGKK